jgi:hypothetical protein
VGTVESAPVSPDGSPRQKRLSVGSAALGEVEPLIESRGMMEASSLGRVALLGQDGRSAGVASNRFDASTEPL